MKRTHKTMTCIKIQALIEVYLDNELMPELVSQMEAHLKQCAACAEELQLAHNVRNTLRTLPAQYCPDRVKQTVLDQDCGARKAISWGRIQSWLTPRPGFRWRPAIAAALVAALVVLTLLMTRPQQPLPASVSLEELARAEIEAKWTLAYVGEIGQRTGITIRDDVIGTRVVAPMRQAIEIALDNEPNNIK